jgi:site-specific recombinase XerD
MNMPSPIPSGLPLPSIMAQLADIPEEEIWLAKQKSARTRRAYRLDVQHFMATLNINPPATIGALQLFKHLVRHSHAAKNPAREIERPAINCDTATKARRSPSRSWSCRLLLR